MRVIVEADGGSRGNPGPAGYGAVVFAEDGRTVLAERMEALGVVSNNVAEYRGLIAGLEAAAELGADDVAVRMDSKLVVEQMSGNWKIKHPDMRRLNQRASELGQTFASVSFEWIAREHNHHADRLANAAMDAAAKVVRGQAAPPVPTADRSTTAHAAGPVVAADPADAADAAVDPVDAADAAGVATARAGLARRVREKALLRGEFTLRSGQVSDQYFDKYLVESDPGLVREAVEAMAALLPDGQVILAGLELGGVPLATLLGQRTGHATRFVRKAAKEYGTRQQIEGGPVDGLQVVLIEDVITSGGAVLAAVDAVRAGGGTVDTVVCLIDRQQGGRSALVARGIAVRAALTAADLVQG